MTIQILVIIIASFVHFRTVRGDNGGVFEGLIVGGKFSRIEEFPHAVFLSIECEKASGKKTQHVCGASIVNQIVLLSAAHCFHDCVRSIVISAFMGNVEQRKGTLRRVTKVRPHGWYNPERMMYDIATLKLESDIKFSKTIKRVVLTQNPKYEKTAVVSGWGLPEAGAKRSSIHLKHITQKVMDYKSCEKLIQGLPHSTICGGDMRAKDYAAKGDSGSALMMHRNIQIGIVSFKVPEFSESIMVYTDVSAFYDWIEKRVRSFMCKP